MNTFTVRDLQKHTRQLIHSAAESKLFLTDKAGQVRELSAEDIRNMRPASEVLSPELLKLLI